MKYLYKILNTAVTVAFIPVLVFLPMFRLILTVNMSSSSSLGILGGLIGSALDMNQIIANFTGIDLEHMPEFYTIKDAYTTLFGDGAKLDTADVDIAALPDGLISSFRNMLIALAVVLIIALVILIIGLFTKKLGANIVLSGAGIIGTWAMNRFFMGAAGPLVSGAMPVSSILAAVGSLADYQSSLQYVDIDVRIFELAGAYKTMYLIFGVLLLVNIIFLIIRQSDDNMTAKEKKNAAKKAERKAAKKRAA